MVATLPRESSRHRAQTTIIIDRPAWDYLTLCDFAVFYLPGGQDDDVQNPGDWMLILRMTADSGHPENRTDVTKFATPDDSRTLVTLYAYFSSQCHEGNWFDTVVDAKYAWPPDAGTRNFDNGFRGFGVTLPLSELSSTEAVEQHVSQFAEGLRREFPEKAAW